MEIYLIFATISISLVNIVRNYEIDLGMIFFKTNVCSVQEFTIF